MPDPTFSQPARRSLTPLLVAFFALALIAAALFYFNPHDTASISLSNTSAVPIRTNFKTQSIVVGEALTGQDDLYVLTTVRIEDHLRLPITIDTIVATLVTADGHQTTTSAATKEDLAAIFGTFPQLKLQQAPPLLRETAIPPGQAAQGQVILHFPIAKAIWDTRKSATLEVDLYHQNPQTVEIR